MNKVHVIVNPFSARGQTGKRWETIKEAIRPHFREFKYSFTEKPRQATEIARELLGDGFDLLIGVGGDGTLNEISSGFFNAQSGQAINRDAAVGIIPSGTGSDFMRFMKVPRDFAKSAARIKNAAIKRIDIGKITYGGTAHQAKTQYFVNVADFGLGAEVIRNVSRIESAQRGAFTYYRGLLATMMKFSSKSVRLTLDGKQQLQGEYLIGAVANGRIFGGGMIIAPRGGARRRIFRPGAHRKHEETGDPGQHPPPLFGGDRQESQGPYPESPPHPGGIARRGPYRIRRGNGRLPARRVHRRGKSPEPADLRENDADLEKDPAAGTGAGLRRPGAGRLLPRRPARRPSAP